MCKFQGQSGAIHQTSPSKCSSSVQIKQAVTYAHGITKLKSWQSLKLIISSGKLHYTSIFAEHQLKLILAQISTVPYLLKILFPPISYL